MGLMETSNALSNIQRRKDAKKNAAQAKEDKAAADAEAARLEKIRKAAANRTEQVAKKTATFEAQMLEQAEQQTALLTRMVNRMGA